MKSVCGLIITFQKLLNWNNGSESTVIHVQVHAGLIGP